MEISFNSSSNAHNNIPFVQIHTTNVQPQRSNYGNVFRRTVTSNHAEIKSEPIKSEAADSSKDRVNATPTPPVRSASCNSNEVVTNSSPRIEELAQAADQDAGVSPQALSNDEIGFPTIHKCNQCRFICLEECKLEDHRLKVHSSAELDDTDSVTTNHQLSCPGCSNVFFACKSLEVHLLEDHCVNEADAKKLIDAYSRSKFSSPTTINGLDKTEERPVQARKSRIYLKNVECLREPRREPLEIDGIHHNHMSDGFYQSNSFNNSSLERHIDLQSVLNSEFEQAEQQNHAAAEQQQHSNQMNISSSGGETNDLLDNRPKQKISIKSVDVLREPALLRRDYEMQNQYCSMTNNCNELNFDTFNGYQPSSGSNDSATLCDLDQIEKNIPNIEEQQRRPKIYIKNVDILKEPIMLPTFATTLGLPDTNASLNYNFMAQSMQQAGTNSDFSNQAYDAENMGTIGPLVVDSFLYENSTNVNDHHINGNSNTGNNLLNDIGGMSGGIGGVDGVDSFQSYGNNGNQMNTGFLTYPIINCNGIDTLPNAPIITEPTPPPEAIFSMQSLEETFCNPIEPISAHTPSTQKQKIFIKNVDILKEPQFQEQRERGTLHLRTVDELNLMNRNEVENLIAPNLENNNNNNNNSNNNNSNSNSNGNSYSTNSDDATELADDDHRLGDGDDRHSEQDIFYDENSMKLQDYASQLVNCWSTDGYDLGDDLDCIITDSIVPINNVHPTLPSLSPCAANNTLFQKVIHDLETPQVSMISIRDIEELTGPPTIIHPTQSITILPPMDIHPFEENVDEESQSSMDMLSIVEDETQKPNISENVDQMEKNNHQQLEKLSSPIPNTQIDAPLFPSISTTSNFHLPISLPPLVPVSADKITTNESAAATSIGSFATPITLAIPVPPLVPVSSFKPMQATTNPSSSTVITPSSTAATAATTAGATGNTIPAERGRIYVANNLMQVETPKTNATTSSSSSTSSTKTQRKSAGISMSGGTSVRGRPFGSNRADNSTNKTRVESEEVVLKCSVRGCAFRFKKPETLDYHKRCHESASSSSQAKICPECKSKDFGNWNTLHTHLWRSHQIDMELYSCPQCPFKTPIYSRLVNTHTKIHSEERNYKCEQCGKAFKNTKQLKNHRRWHRTHAHISGNAGTADMATNSSNCANGNANSNNTNETTLNADEVTTTNFHRCIDCGATFSHQKTLREHSCKKSDNQLICSICDHVASSKSSLKLHMFTHENSKRLKCNCCTYSTSDHNAFRRHKMTHENSKMYVCPHCSYKSIQSVTFQKHVLMKHPDSAETLIHKCKLCTYSTVNRSLFNIHQIRHKSLSSHIISNDAEQSNSSVEVVESENVSDSVPILLNKSSISDNQITNNNSSNNNNNNTSINNNNINNNNCNQEQSKELGTQQHKGIKVKNDLMNTFGHSASTREQSNMEWYDTN